MRKGHNDYVNLICQKIETERLLKDIQKSLNKYIVDEQEFLNMAKEQLSEHELKVIEECSINNRSFKAVSDEFSYPYHEVRETWIAAKDKLNVISHILDNQV